MDISSSITISESIGASVIFLSLSSVWISDPDAIVIVTVGLLSTRSPESVSVSPVAIEPVEVDPVSVMPVLVRRAPDASVERVDPERDPVSVIPVFVAHVSACTTRFPVDVSPDPVVVRSIDPFKVSPVAVIPLSVDTDPV
jgi:hypothetical protein